MGEVLIGGTVALLLCVFLSPRFIAFLHDREFGQTIREEGPAGHHPKAGTPTMGGIIIFLAISVPFDSAHMRLNALAALAAARAIGVEPAGAVRVALSRLRGERIALQQGVVVINDCYNANPMSMRAALDDLAETAAGRRVAVLGDMLELGPQERHFHAELGDHARATGVEVLVTVGDLAAEAGAGTGGEAHNVRTATQAAKLLPSLLQPGDTVLVKGSRGVGLEIVAEALEAREA